jgi:hypothetical protein
MREKNSLELKREAFKEGRKNMPTGQILSIGKELSKDENKGLDREQLEQKSQDQARIYYLLSARRDRKLSTSEVTELTELQNKWKNSMD